jgi:hypothetical protein
MQTSIQGLPRQSLDNQASDEAIRKTRLLYVFVCLYVLAQSYMIPIAAIGPSWAIWPTLADLAMIPLICLAILGFRDEDSANKYHIRFQKLLALMWCFGTMAYLYTIAFSMEREAFSYGFYFIFRFTEFCCLFWAVSRLPWTHSRIDRLRVIVDVVLLITCIGVIFTFLGIIPLGKLIAHLPQSKAVSGPWVAYLLKEQFPEDGRGVGMVGYNHAYGGVQIVALTAFRFSLARSRIGLASGFLILIAVVASFLTESRAGFAALVFFLGTQFVRNPKMLLACIPVALVGLIILDLRHEDMAATFQRQQTILSATEGDNLSGRQDIWKAYTGFMLERPSTFLIGAGLGASYPVTPNRSCHMTPLQYFFEMGILGLGAYALIVWTIVTLLFRFEEGAKPLLFAYLALLIASMTMETFWPIPYLSHFIGLCFLILSSAMYKFPRGDVQGGGGALNRDSGVSM